MRGGKQINFLKFPLPAKISISTEVLFGFGVALLQLLLNLHASRCGFSDALIGILLSSGYGMSALASFLCGRFADRIGFSYVMRAGNIASGAGLIMLGLSRSVTAIFAGYLIYSAGYACAMAMEYNLPLSFLKKEQSIDAYNMVLIFYYIGSITANLSGGRLADKLAFTENPYAILLLFGGIVFLILGMVRSRIPNRPCRVYESDSGEQINFASAFRNPQILSFLLFGIITMGLFAMSSGMMNLVLRYRYFCTDTVIGRVYSLGYVAGLLVLIVLPILIRRTSLRRISTVTMLIQFTALTIAICCSAPVFILMMVVRQACCSILYTSADGDMLKSVNDSMKGTYSGLRICANNVGMSVFAVISGRLVGSRNFALFFVVCAGISLVQNIIYHVLCEKYLGDAGNKPKE